jgi:hypothetical protein
VALAGLFSVAGAALCQARKGLAETPDFRAFRVRQHFPATWSIGVNHALIGIK